MFWDRFLKALMYIVIGFCAIFCVHQIYTQIVTKDYASIEIPLIGMIIIYKAFRWVWKLKL